MSPSIPSVGPSDARQFRIPSQTPPKREPVSQETIDSGDRISNNFAKEVRKSRKMAIWLHAGSLVIGVAALAYAIYVFSNKKSTTNDKLSAGLGLLTVPLNIWDIISLKRLFKEQKEQKTTADSPSIQENLSEQRPPNRAIRA